MADTASQKLSCCGFISCPGRCFRADQVCYVCGAAVHSLCFRDVSAGQNYTPGNFYCSVQCIRYDNDDSIDNNAVKAKRETLMASNKNDLRKLARSLGVKISYRLPGQGSKDLSKEGIIARVMEKTFITEMINGVDSAAAAASGVTPPPTSIVTIHDNFRLVNVMFSEDVMNISTQCGNAATRNELDTNLVGSNSPFWNKVSSLFHSIDGCDPNTDGVDFLDKVHFEHTYYGQHHEAIDPSKHGTFPNDKLRSMWNKIKSDYDQAMVNFTKSGNHASSFTAAAMREIKRQEKTKLKVTDTSGKEDASLSDSSLEEEEDFDDMEDDPEGIGDKGFSNFTRSLVVIYLRQWLNEKPEQTNFCSRQLPIEAQSDSLAVAVSSSGASGVSTLTTTSSKKKKRSKVTGMDVMMDLVTEMRETRRDRTSSVTAFGMSASPATKKMKKHISSMLCAQAKSAKNNAEKDKISLLQVKLMAAKENAANYNVGSQERRKADAVLAKLQKKLNAALDSSSDDMIESETDSDGNI